MNTTLDFLELQIKESESKRGIPEMLSRCVVDPHDSSISGKENMAMGYGLVRAIRLLGELLYDEDLDRANFAASRLMGLSKYNRQIYGYVQESFTIRLNVLDEKGAWSLDESRLYEELERELKTNFNE